MKNAGLYEYFTTQNLINTTFSRTFQLKSDILTVRISIIEYIRRNQCLYLRKRINVLWTSLNEHRVILRGNRRFPGANNTKLADCDISFRVALAITLSEIDHCS